MKTVVVLGAKGRFGRAAVTAFTQAGWTVRAFGRNLKSADFPGVTCVEGDAQDAGAVTQACQGADVVVYAIHPPYANWARDMPGLTRSAITAARAADATVLIPGNVYNYGEGMPPVLSETTPWRPTTRKGRLRVTMEESFRQSGVRTIVLRAGDFFEARQTGNWFEDHLTIKSDQGQTMYPGPLDLMHAWAYLPDMARAAVGLAEKRQSFASFEEFTFGGYGVTGREMVDQIETAIGVPQRVKSLPWSLLRLLGVVAPKMREVHEMRYLWQVPHQLDGGKLARALPDFVPTPFAEAIAEALAHRRVHPVN